MNTISDVQTYRRHVLKWALGQIFVMDFDVIVVFFKISKINDN
jgi:hypothetical protein